MDKFLNSHNLSKLNQEDINSLKRSGTSYTIIRAMPTVQKKNPELDAFTAKVG